MLLFTRKGNSVLPAKSPLMSRYELGLGEVLAILAAITMGVSLLLPWATVNVEASTPFVATPLSIKSVSLTFGGALDFAVNGPKGLLVVPTGRQPTAEVEAKLATAALSIYVTGVLVIGAIILAATALKWKRAALLSVGLGVAAVVSWLLSLTAIEGALMALLVSTFPAVEGMFAFSLGAAYGVGIFFIGVMLAAIGSLASPRRSS